MTDPATREDVEKAKREILERLGTVDASVEAMRGQNSAEHGSLFSKLLHITEVVHWVKSKWERFTRVPDPNDKPPPK